MAGNNTITNNWCVPNWRNPEEYEFSNPHSATPLINDQLRWEFLRRDKEYRQTWKDLKAVRYNFGLINPIDPKLSAKDLKDQSVLFINSVMRGSPIDLALPKLVNLSGDEFIKQYGEHVLTLSDDEGFLIVGFDLRHPIRPQIDRAGEVLEFHRQQLIDERLKDAKERRGDGAEEKEMPQEIDDIFYREHALEKPQNLLRTLDAHNEDVSLEEIGQKIFGHTHNDADGKSNARAVAHERLSKAKTCWKYSSPHKRHVVL